MKSDTQLESDVLDEIRKDPNTTTAQVGVTAANGVVTLTGTVATYTEKIAVERAAQRVSGVRGIAEEVIVKITDPPVKSVDVIDQETIGELTGNDWMSEKMRINRYLLSGMIVIYFSGISHTQNSSIVDLLCIL